MITLPKNDVEKQQYLTQIAKKLSKEKIYKETDINDIILSFDPDDHVLMRRELVNFGYLGRDPYKGTYWLIKKELSQEELEKIESRQRNIKKMR